MTRTGALLALAALAATTALAGKALAEEQARVVAVSGSGESSRLAITACRRIVPRNSSIAANWSGSAIAAIREPCGTSVIVPHSGR